MSNQFDALIELLAQGRGFTTDEGEAPKDMPEAACLEHIIQAGFSEVADALEGTALEGLMERILRAWTDSLHRLLESLEKSADRVTLEQKQSLSEQDFSEVKSVELERLTDKARLLEAQSEALTVLRDAAADTYQARSGQLWRPMHGSRPSSKILTGAMVDARDQARARKLKHSDQLIVEGPRIAVFGDKHDVDYRRIADVLDKAKEKYPDMVLLSTGQKSGADACALSWAKAKGVDAVVFKLEGRAADRFFRRNEKLLSECPKGVIVFSEASSYTRHAVETARKMGLKLMRCGRAAAMA